jgi:hypothetical protein
MKVSVVHLVKGMILYGAMLSTGALACDQAFDGCLGCNDDQLPVCLRAFVQDICKASGDPANCDTQRVYDDAERYVTISTGSHMARVSTMVRTARKYRLH